MESISKNETIQAATIRNISAKFERPSFIIVDSVVITTDGRTDGQSIQKLVKKFKQLGQVGDENIAAVAQSVEENLGLSIPRRSLQLSIPQTSLHRILHKDLVLKAYKVRLTQELKPADHQQRRVHLGG